jgi:hypothetical protein
MDTIISPRCRICGKYRLLEGKYLNNMKPYIECPKCKRLFFDNTIKYCDYCKTELQPKKERKSDG